MWRDVTMPINQYVEHVHEVQRPIDLECMLCGFESLFSCKAELPAGNLAAEEVRSSLRGCLPMKMRPPCEKPPFKAIPNKKAASYVERQAS